MAVGTAGKPQARLTATILRHPLLKRRVQVRGQLHLAAGPVDPKLPEGTVHYILVLDTSGSMAGRPIREINTVLHELPKRLEGNARVHVVSYNSTASLYPDARLEDMELRGMGLTSFMSAFHGMIRLLEQLKPQAQDSVRICFMTDGENTRDSYDLAMIELREALNALNVRACVVDVVAFGVTRVHQLLETLRVMGQQEGAYLYAKGSDGPTILQEMMTLILDSAGFASRFEKRISIDCQPLGLSGLTVSAIQQEQAEASGSNQEPRAQAKHDGRETADDNDGNDSLYGFSCWAYEPKREGSDAGWEAMSHPVDVILPDGLDDGAGQPLRLSAEATIHTLTEAERLYYDILLDQVDAEIDRLCSIKGQALELDQRRDVEALQHKLNVCGRVYSRHDLGRVHRAELLTRRMEVQSRLDELHQLIMSAARAANSDEVLSQMSNLRFAGKLKARRQRVLARRVADNSSEQDLTAQLQQLYVRLPAKLDLDPAMDKYFSCLMSQATLSEILNDTADNVLGFGLSIRRPEAMIDAPSLVHVDEISLTFLSRESMLDALKYKLSIADQLAAHGGFEMRLSTPAAMTVGAAREPINAWLPLYIHPLHWERAKLLLKPSLGYFCCLDPLAFHEYQLDVPLVVLATMLVRLCTQPVQRGAELFVSFRRTCRALAEDFGTLATLREKLSLFCTQPEHRLKHHVTNPMTLLGAYLILDADEREHLEANHFSQKMGLELLRRGLHAAYEAAGPGTLTDMAARLVLGHKDQHFLSTEDDAVAQLVTLMSQTSAHDDDDDQADGDNHGDGQMAGDQAFSEAGRQAGDDTSSSSDACAATYRLDQTGFNAEVEAHPLVPMTLDNATRRALTVVAQSCYNAVPGPNIQQKTDAARARVEAWWAENQALARASLGSEEMQELLAQRDCFSDVKLEALARILRRGRAHQYPQPADILAFKNVAALLGDDDDDDAGDGNQASGVSQLEVQAVRVRAALENLARESTLRDELQLWSGTVPVTAHQLRGLALGILQVHTNKSARAAVAREGYRDVDAVDYAQRVIDDQLSRLNEREEANLEQRCRQACVPAVLGHMLRAEDMDIFLGLLVTLCSGRDQAYRELWALLLSDRTQPRALTAKVRLVLTGMYRDAAVFDRGNPNFPSGTADEQLRKRLGEYDYLDVRKACLARVRYHQYRESGIANRHGSSNEHPHLYWKCALCRANNHPFARLGLE